MKSCRNPRFGLSLSLLLIHANIQIRKVRGDGRLRTYIWTATLLSEIFVTFILNNLQNFCPKCFLSASILCTFFNDTANFKVYIASVMG
jgi:hypothetical protein